MRSIRLDLRTALLATALLGTGCLTGQRSGSPKPPPRVDSTEPAETTTPKGVKVEDEREKDRIRFVGVKQKYGGTQGNVYLLRSWVDRNTRDITHQVYVTDRYLAESARRWESAAGPKGERLKFTKIDTKTENCSPDGCPRVEAFGAGISDSALRAAKKIGYTIRFEAMDGTKTSVTVTPDQIDAQFDAINEKLASMPAPKKQAPKKPKPKAKTTTSTTPANTGY